MNTDGCKGCSSENSRCTELYRQIDGNIYTCPCASCIVKMMCKQICGSYIKHFEIGGEISQWVAKEWT